MWHDDSIVVKSVRDKGISREIGRGYILKSIRSRCCEHSCVVVAGEKYPLAVQTSSVERVIALLQQASSYPLETTFVNPILRQI